MATPIYDRLVKLIPKALFRREQFSVGGLLYSALPDLQIQGKVPGPWPDLPGTELIFRVDGGDILTVEFTATDPLDVVAEIDAVYPGIATTNPLDQLILGNPNLRSFELFLGNSVLGIYEPHDFKVLLKLISSEIQVTKTIIEAFVDIVDPKTAPLEFLRELGKRVDYVYDNSIDTEIQRKRILERPHVHRYKGTTELIEHLIRIRGGRAEIFQPYPYIGKYERLKLDGSKNLKTNFSRAYDAGQIITVSTNPPEFRFIDLAYAPFVEDDVFRTLFIPNMSGPPRGFRIGRYISASEVRIFSESPGDGTGVVYQLVDPSPIFERIQSREYWNRGVYEICATIPPQDYREEILRLAHPAGRVVYFCYQDEPEIIEMSVGDLATDYILEISQFVPLSYYCGALFDVLKGPLDEDNLENDGHPGVDESGASFDGCQIIFGPELEICTDLFAHARHLLEWSQVLYWEDVAGDPKYFLDFYLDMDSPFNSVTLLPEGHVWTDALTDQQPTIMIIIFKVFSGIIRGAGALDVFPTEVPSGAEIVEVNMGGTFDTGTDSFSGGTTYVQGVDWEQDGDSIEWIGAAPLVTEEYQVYYRYDPYNPYVG